MSWGATDLQVRFGKTVALDGVSIEIRAGSVHAVVGGDGAGKTTLLRILAGVGIQFDGRVRLPAPGRTGYVPPAGGVFGDLSVAENMEFIADAYRLSSWRARGEELLTRVGLEDYPDRLAAQLSGGQRRKLAGSMALLPEPELLVLDEVTTGVDPVSRMDLWRLVAGAAAGGAGVVVATSYLDEAERAESVLLLHEGRTLASGTPAEIIAGMRGSVSDVSEPREAATAWRKGRRWRQWNPDGRADSDRHVALEDVAIVAELMAEGVGR